MLSTKSSELTDGTYHQAHARAGTTHRIPVDTVGEGARAALLYHNPQILVQTIVVIFAAPF